MKSPAAIKSPIIDSIRRLKKERNAVILAHNYMPPEIFFGIADHTGDSLALAQKAVSLKEDLIIVCGVHFMAETAKLLNPEKTVLSPDPSAGCSLADSIRPEDIAGLRRSFPGAPVVTYVNTGAAVKAASDICCTSGNVLEVVRSLPADELILLPDVNLAAYAADRCVKKIHSWHGSCVVHDKFDPDIIRSAREKYGDELLVAAHPECGPEVIAMADMTGSTAAIRRLIGTSRPRYALILTEDSMNRNLALEYPETLFLPSGERCPWMEQMSLEMVASALESLSPRVEIPMAIQAPARRALSLMLSVH